jgi:hypothetical protein
MKFQGCLKVSHEISVPMIHISKILFEILMLPKLILTEIES